MRKLAFATALILAAVPARAQNEAAATARCASADVNIAITGCTELIQTAHQTTQILAFAYNDRAWAYHRQGNDQAGLRDVNMALILAPNNAAVKLNPKMTQASDGLKRLGATP